MQEQLESITKRKGDTVSYKTVLHVKDTTIYTVNRQGTTLKTVYDESGNVSQVDCFSSAIDELVRYNKSTQQDSSTKDKEEQYHFDPTFIYAIAGAIVLLGGLALFLLYKSINKQAALINVIAERLK